MTLQKRMLFGMFIFYGCLAPKGNKLGSDSASFTDPGASSGCDLMVKWFEECNDDSNLSEIETHCLEEVLRIQDDCSQEASDAFVTGMEATYSCYLDNQYCGTAEDLTSNPGVAESCNDLYADEIEDFSVCFDQDDPLPFQESLTLEPEEIPYIPTPDLTQSFDFEDDSYQSILLPFEMIFFDTNITSLTVTSNGVVFIGEQSSDGCCFPLSIPNQDHLNGLIALGWSDLIPNPSQKVKWDIVGDPPLRSLWVQYDNIPILDSEANGFVSSSLKYEEGSSSIEIHIAGIRSDEAMTIGVEDQLGQIAIVKEEHNNTSITIDSEGYRYATEDLQ